MKKIFLVVCLLVAAVMGANAQKGTASIGADLLYGTDIERAGLGIKMQYNITDPLRVAADWDYFFKQNGFTYWTIDLTANYMIDLGSNVSFYPLAGLCVAYGSLAHYDDESKLGFDIGGGLQYDINDLLYIDLEVKGQLVSHWNQAVFGIGIGYKF